MEFRLVRTELFHVDGRTDKHDVTNSRFSQFCKSAYKRKDHKSSYIKRRND